LGTLKCLDALGRWEEAIALSKERASDFCGDNIYHKASVIGARAAWSLNKWQDMESLVTQLPKENVDASFLRAVLAVHEENFPAAAEAIDLTRRQLYDSLTALFAESYSRAYIPLVMLQQLSELEEITEYKTLLREAGLSDDPSLCSRGDQSSRPSFDTSTASPVTSIGAMTVDSGDSRSSRRLGSIMESMERRGGLAESNTNHLRTQMLQRKSFLADKWRARIKGCRSSGRAAIPVWHYILNVRRMILSKS